ncbi:hypothetical protein LO772_01345 [Yinghuangia sp. ASG 101]|uniref:hypothetical protein n=1 Tax=Yinghuangia sp. ASG 101 TaxID=2896848 RepID=UPI001E559BB7|nr:hypothetical protein [Yinghuangia sp. ASG 101]UGQ12284.1 hypothetical protein LO772_01345 [Yinghuangia sp. ASG 101]
MSATPEAGLDAPLSARASDVVDPGIPGMMRTPLWWPNDEAPPGGSPHTSPPRASSPPRDAWEPPDPETHGDPATDTAEVPPAPSEFAWSFDDVEEVRARPSVGRGIAWIAVAVAGVLGLVTTVVVAGGDGARKPPATTPPPAGAPPAAPPGPPEAYMPRDLVLGGFDGRVQVTWQPPERADAVAGFMVIAQSRQGVVLEHRLAPAGETSAVFASPPMTRDACVVVATLVRGDSGVSPVRAEPVCL